MSNREMENHDEDFLEETAIEFMNVTYSIMKTETNMELKPFTF
jgi:hypothetical protein